MMNQEIKRRIDNARQVLVGKVPDPKSQVEQITTALIYKFMDDMDKESERLGGKSTFFVNDYKTYSWTKLMDSRLGGQERLNLYAKAISNLSQNPHLPQLFRDIFKDAYLPYGDPETLNLFLKEIDNFSYGSTDNLGDAYEYLLSVLGSQGGAGQFLTPRHIIKFIVSIVDPKKNETILDPACGTAGFLILAYLHILEANTENKPRDMLTPDEKAKLIHNFVGYDIDPGMVRLSLVNMYLHKFPLPHIYEYDTLTYEDRWQDQFDVIMANPPFMSPKGGIRPHKRFAIHANRSEVLFVDYIAEHLTMNGRAGVIVPEGIIFQSANAHKSLRKMLISDYLWAVVSLPVGVFQPYSGVKTSILFMDKSLAKQTDKILFMKIKNVGFDLGAQRREIDRNDLPLAAEVMNFYKDNIRENNNLELPEGYSKIANIITKQKIIESSDYNLTSDRYKEVANFANQKWSMARLGDYIKERKERVGQEVLNMKAWSVSNMLGFMISEEYFDKKVASDDKSNYKKIFPFAFAYNPSRINVGSIALNETQNIGCVSPMYVVFNVSKGNNLDSKFLLYLVKSDIGLELIRKNSQGAVRQQLRYDALANFQIPLPPLEIQKQIVQEIEGHQKIIDGARQVVQNWKPTFKIDPEWPTLVIEESLENVKYTVKVKNSAFLESGKYPVIDQSEKFIAGYWDNEDDLFRISKPVTIFGDHTRCFKYIDFDFVLGADGVKILQPKEFFNPKFFYYALSNLEIKSLGYSRHYKELKEQKIPLPPLEIQKQIVLQIEEEQKAVDACKKLIEINEQKIKSKISEVWGEE
jgi:type I restriction enzyme M protein